MPLQQTTGNVTTDAYGGGVAAVPNYIEDVFSTYLYTGNGSTQTITNGIDLSTKGGLVWLKQRNTTGSNLLFDTDRGAGHYLISNGTSPDQYYAPTLTSFNATGFTLGNASAINGSGDSFVSWNLRKQPKFFDIVSFNGSSSPQNIAHNLGSTPGCIFVKNTSNGSLGSDWCVYHQSLGATKSLFLNTTAAFATSSDYWNNTSPTSSVFTVGTGVNTNNSGETYVAYLFAHNAGGFGLTGTDNVISCGSFTTDVNGSATVSLGYEPQWFLVKQTSAAENWFLYDTMRGFANLSDQVLFPNLSNAESNFTPTTSSYFTPTATGVNAVNWFGANSNYIYIAIRRGPMKVPTSGTSVFSPNATTASINTKITTNFPIDLQMQGYRPGFSGNIRTIDRLRGTGTIPSSTSTTVPQIATSSAAAEANASAANGWDNTGFQIPSSWNGDNMVYWNFKRAPSFFDEVCYSGTSANRTVAHNLGVAPELILIKIRNEASGWRVYASPLTATSYLILNQTNESSTSSTTWNNTTPTSSVFSLGTDASVNGPYNYVAYLFSTCAGVSKVGSYTGNGSTQTINCGFTGGARFVLIKRTDSTGDWYVYDTARGMTTLTDPYLLLNSTAAESATLGSVTTVSTGFAVNASILAAINTNAASYIFLAIA